MKGDISDVIIDHVIIDHEYLVKPEHKESSFKAASRGEDHVKMEHGYLD